MKPPLKESRLSVCIKPELRNEFIKAIAKTETNGTVSSVLRELIQSYILNTNGENVTRSERKAFIDFA